MRVLIRHYGDSFKWLFYGDDDSVLFLRGAMNIVAGLDPAMPYALTGGLWCPPTVPSAAALLLGHHAICGSFCIALRSVMHAY